MTTEMLEARVEAKSIIVETGECKTCRWKSVIKDRIASNPNYVPYGGRRKCADTKNYKNCSGYMPVKS